VLVSATDADSRASARLAAEWAAEASLRESLYAQESAAIASDCEALQSEQEKLAELTATLAHLKALNEWSVAQEQANARSISAIVAHTPLARELAKRQEKAMALSARAKAAAAAEQRALQEAEQAERSARDAELMLSANRLRLREATVRQQSAAATLDVLREDHEDELARLTAALEAARQTCPDAAALNALIRLCRGLEANRDAAVQQVRALRVAAKARTRQ
jgi:hypothetical protein